MKRYRLLKDLPGVKAGEIVDSNNLVLVHNMDDLPDWFAPVDERWMPEDGEQFFWIDDNGRIANCFYHNGWKSVADFGNCFRTREQAEKAAEAMKKVLLEMGKEGV